MNINGAMMIHICNAVRVQVPKNTAILFHEDLYYADAKTRNTPRLQHDTHFHSYVYPFASSNTRGKRTDGFNDGITREVGRRVY